MVLMTKDDKGVARRHAVEVIYDDDGKIEHMRVPFIIEGHVMKEAHLETAIKTQRVDVSGQPYARFGRHITFAENCYDFYNKYS